MADDLKEEFPEIEESTLKAILANAGDSDKAREMLKQFAAPAPKPVVDGKDAKIKELQFSFPKLPREEIVKALEANGWVVENCFVTLVTAATKMSEPSEKERNAIRQRKRKQDLRGLQNAFARMKPDIVEKVLDECEGNPTAAADKILVLIAEEDAKEKKIMKERRNDDVIDKLRKKFRDVDFDVIMEAAIETDYDLDKAIALIIPHISKKLAIFFPNISKEKRQAALIANELQLRATIDYLANAKEPVKSESGKSVEEKPAPSLEESIALVSKKMKSQIKTESPSKDRAEEIQKLLMARNPAGEPAPAAVVKGKEAPKGPGKAAPASAEALVDLEIEVKATPKVDRGNKIKVSWKKIGGARKLNSWDWIGLFKVGAQKRNYVTYDWPRAKETGELTFTAPAEYGRFEFRYMTNEMHSVGTSNIVEIGPVIDMSWKEEGDSWDVSFLQRSGNTSTSAFIGLYRKSEKTNANFLEKKFCKAAIMNSLSFKKPKNSGQYEFRYINTSDNATAAHTSTITIPGEDVVKAAVPQLGVISVAVDLRTVDPASESAWIGIYFVNEKSHTKYRRYKRLNRKKQSVNFLQGPRTAGEYEARIFANGTYDLVTRSNSFIVEDSG